uniref:Uncharacterized protein n=1 Tax=Arundo donax TaxID=35708 RepID=A0A0A9A424_ARUDO
MRGGTRMLCALALALLCVAAHFQGACCRGHRREGRFGRIARPRAPQRRRGRERAWRMEGGQRRCRTRRRGACLVTTRVEA